LGEKTGFGGSINYFWSDQLAGISSVHNRIHDATNACSPDDALCRQFSFSRAFSGLGALTWRVIAGFIPPMRFSVVQFGFISYALAVFAVNGAEEPKILEEVKPLPVALSKDFEFRKTKLFSLSETPLNQRQRNTPSKKSKPGKVSSTSPSSKSATVQDASITFERQYRLFGAVTLLDSRQRFGDYFDFFWRSKRPADITVRLEYRQEKLHEHVQAQEISYRNVRGTHKTEFKIIGDDYLDDGRVISWRCLLIENGRIVAENRSYMWK
jgi:hypothetical protein